jgi:hypothetical protein
VKRFRVSHKATKVTALIPEGANIISTREGVRPTQDVEGEYVQQTHGWCAQAKAQRGFLAASDDGTTRKIAWRSASRNAASAAPGRCGIKAAAADT